MPKAPAKAPPPLTKLEQAAVFLISVGEADAAQVLKHMGPKEVQRVGTSMATLEKIGTDQVQEVLNQFLSGVGEETGLTAGTDDYIRNMLHKALGEDKANGLIDRILLGGNTTGLDTLKWMEARAVADIIRYEHPQIQAIVISYLDADHAAGVITQFTDTRVRLDIMMRVASLETIQPRALQELNEILEKQFSSSTASQSTSMGGVKTAAEIMNNLESSTEAELMDAIKQTDEDLGIQIEELMFVFENLIDIDDRGIQALLREVASDSLILALKGSDEDMQEKIFRNMSKRAAELLRDDLEAKGPVKVSEVEVAQKEILAAARRMAEAGEIVLGGAGGEEML